MRDQEACGTGVTREELADFLSDGVDLDALGELLGVKGNDPAGTLVGRVEHILNSVSVQGRTRTTCRRSDDSDK